jgi:predicted transcriptional regulator
VEILRAFHRKLSTVLVRTDATTLELPSWMLDASVCASLVDEREPRVSVAALRALRELIDAQTHKEELPHDCAGFDREPACLGDRAQRAYGLLRRQPKGLTRREAADRLDCLYGTAVAALDELIQLELVVSSAPSRPFRYRVACACLLEVPGRGDDADSALEGLRSRARRALETLRDKATGLTRRELAGHADFSYDTAKRALDDLLQRGLVASAGDKPVRYRLIEAAFQSQVAPRCSSASR